MSVHLKQVSDLLNKCQSSNMICELDVCVIGATGSKCMTHTSGLTRLIFIQQEISQINDVHNMSCGRRHKPLSMLIDVEVR